MTWTCQLCEATSAGTDVRRATTDRSICTWCEGELARTNRRRCRKCGVVKPLPFVRKGRWCAACDSATNADYLARNRERILTKRRADYAADPEQKKAAVRARHARLRDRINAAKRAKYAADPTRQKAIAKRWYDRNKEKSALKWQRYRAAHPGYAAAHGRRTRVRRKLAILRGLR